MTRKDYKAIASELARQHPYLSLNADRCPSYLDSTPWVRGAYDEWATIVIGIASVLHRDNPAFDRSRFATACGLAS